MNARFILALAIGAVALGGSQIYGAQWETVFPEPGPSRFLSGATDGQVMVLGGPNGEIWLTEDGVNFQRAATEATFNVKRVATGGVGQWAALASEASDSGNSTVLMSHDAQVWGETTTPGLGTQQVLATDGAGNWLLAGSTSNDSLLFAAQDQLAVFLTRTFDNWEKVPVLAVNTGSLQPIRYAAFEADAWWVFTNSGVYRSDDARSWTQVSSSFPRDALVTAHAYHDGRWVLQVGGRVLVSSDNWQTFQEVTLPGGGFSSSGGSVVFDAAAGRFIFVGEEGVIAVTNGLNVAQWAVLRVSSYGHPKLNVILPFRGFYYVFGDAGFVERAPLGNITPSAWQVLRGSRHVDTLVDLQFDGSDFWVGREADGDVIDAIFRSPDGRKWEVVADDFVSPSGLPANQTILGGFDLVAGNGIALLPLRYFNSNVRNYLRVAAGGATAIHPRSVVAIDDVGEIYFAPLNIVGYANGRFFGTADTGSDFTLVVYTSTDGIGWSPTAGSFPNQNDGEVVGVAYRNGVYVAIRRWGKVLRSTNLASGWTVVDTGEPELREIVAGPPGFVLVGFESVLSSTDGSLFFSTTGTSAMRSVGFFDDAFYGIGFFGDVYRSLDGSSWSSVLTFPGQDLLELAVGAGQLIATAEADFFSARQLVSFPTGPLPTPSYRTVPRFVSDINDGRQAVVVIADVQPTVAFSGSLTEAGQPPLTFSFFPGLSFRENPRSQAVVVPFRDTVNDRVLSVPTSAGVIGGSDAVVTVRREPDLSASLLTWEAFQTANFTAAQIADGRGAPTFDFDGDGVPNLLEAPFRMNPLVADPEKAPQFSVIDHPRVPGATQIVATVDRVYDNTNIQLALETTRDLENFFGLFIEDSETRAIPGSTTDVAVTIRSIPVLPTALPLMTRVRASLRSNQLPQIAGWGQGSAFTGADLFNAASLDTTLWNEGRFSVPSGVTVGLDSSRGTYRLQGNITGRNDAVVVLSWLEKLPLGEDWLVQVQFDADFPLSFSGGSAELGLVLLGNATNASDFQGGLSFIRENVNLVSFEGERGTRISSQDSGQTVPSSGSLRLIWTASNQTLSAFWAGGTSADFTALGTPQSNFFRTGLTETFIAILLRGDAINITGGLSADNFQVLSRP